MYPLSRFASVVALVVVLGFWSWPALGDDCGCRSSDFDNDGDVDQVDFGHLAACFTGPAGVVVEACRDADLDGNGAVDLGDYQLFAACVGGATIPVAAGQFDQVFISEFMASNGNGITDEDGGHPDWIELYNPCRPVVNLDGYYLTDDPADLMKWRLPAVTLGKGKFLVVFASGKDRAVAGQPLHTSFKLSAGGGFLALVAPDGQTIVHAYQPTYPEQLADFSYGLTQSATQLVARRAAVKYHVPVAANAAIGTGWTAPAFADGVWSSGNTGLGFSSIPPFFNVTVYKGSGSVCNLTTAESVIANPSQQAWTASESASVINYLNTVTSANFGNDATFPGMQIGADMDNFVVLVTGTIIIPTTGEWTFGVNSDDGFALKLTRGTTVFESSYPPPRGPADTLTVFNVAEAGAYEVRLVFYECGGGSELEFFAAQGYYQYFDANAFRLVGDSANGGLAVGVLGGTIQTDVGAQMRGKNASLWTRVPFQVADPTAFNYLALRMTYEDGFVAWLNGHEVVRRNAPASLLWNSAALVDRPLTESAASEEIDLTSFLKYLQVGNNVLAIQGLNDAAADPDFVIVPELVAGQTTVQQQYFATATPGTYNATGTVDFVRNLSFSVEHGFFSSPFQLQITSPTPDIQIRYTLDGSTPSSTNGQIYTGPIAISGTSVVRAGGFRTNFLPSRIATQSYIFVNDVVNQSPNGEVPPGWPADGAVNGHTFTYGLDPNVTGDARYAGLVDDALLAIPSVSLVTDLPNLFDSSIGIYVNPGGDGQAWERPASVELINPDGSPGFQINAGVRVRGGYSRSSSNPKHAFRFFFRSDYGDGKLNFPLFGTEGASEFSKVDLATAQNYSWSFEGGASNTFLRDVFSRDSQGAMGKPYARTRYYHLYINGVYWGLFYTDERTEADYAATYFGGSDTDYDVIKVDPGAGYYIYATNGNMDAWYALWQMCGEDGTTQYGSVSNAVYQQILGCNPDGTRNPAYPVMVDADNLIDYMMCTIFVGDPDGPVAWGGDFPNNFFAVRDKNGQSGFRFFRHDAEHSMGCATGDPNENRTGPYDAGRTFDRFNPFRIHQDLITCTDYRTRFSDRVYQVMFNNGAFTPQATLARVAARRDQINMAIIAESARWGDSKVEPARTKDDSWLPAVNWILNSYLPNRTTVVTQQLRDKGWFKDPPVVSRQGGNVAVGTEVSLSFPAASTGTIYYTLDGTDPRLPGGAVSPQAQVYQASSTPVMLIPRNSTWKYLADGSNQGTAWRALAFTETGWKGPQATRLGYGGDGETSPALSYGTDANNKYMTYYFRTTFAVGDSTKFTYLTLRLLRDDGAVVYINGTKVPLSASVSNMPDDVNYLTPASSGVGDAAEQTFYEASISPNLLNPNTTNIIAVEVHQNSGGSSDIGFNLELEATQVTTSTPIIINANTRLKARILNGSEWTAVNAADYLTGPVPIYINELVASNSAGLEDPDEPGEHPDWFELYNPNAFEVDLGGMYVTDTLTIPNEWRLPDGLTIGAGEFMVFYADSDPTQGPRHVNFKLSNSGEAVGLFARDGATPIDTVTFGAQATDVSYGRYPDGTGAWGAAIAPTPGAANAAHP